MEPLSENNCVHASQRSQFLMIYEQWLSKNVLLIIATINLCGFLKISKAFHFIDRCEREGQACFKKMRASQEPSGWCDTPLVWLLLEISQRLLGVHRRCEAQYHRTLSAGHTEIKYEPKWFAC